MRTVTVLTGILIASASLAFAQPASNETTGPARIATGVDPVEVPQIEAPHRPAQEEQTGLMKGDRPFSLTTDPSGELLYNFNEDNELESVTAKKGVVFTSEDMTLNADQLDYKAETSALVATGRKVIVRQGEMIATCQLFKYFPDTQKSELSGTPIVAPPGLTCLKEAAAGRSTAPLNRGLGRAKERRLGRLARRALTDSLRWALSLQSSVSSRMPSSA